LFANTTDIAYNWFMSDVKNKPQKESEWDKKKIIFITVIVFILLISVFWIKDLVLGKNTQSGEMTRKVKGISIQSDVRKNVADQINTLKEEAGNINLVDIATSSPQVQKIINDLKAIKDYPNNQLRQTCINMCSKL
jgi:hypothetical protein